MIGYQSGYYHTGGPNTFVGRYAGRGTTGTAASLHNAAFGYNALQAINQGDYNVAVGSYALDANTSASRNTAVGYDALSANTTSADNTAVGYEALKVATGSANYLTAVGSGAGKSCSSGGANTFLGYEAGDLHATGAANIVIGARTESPSTSASESITIGYNAAGYSAGYFTVCDPDGKSYIEPGQTSWSGTSDAGYKENIATSTAGLSFINDLRPVTFTYRKKKDIEPTIQGYTTDAVEGETYYKGSSRVTHGFIAQEVKIAIDNHSEVKDGHRVWRAKEPDQFYEEDRDAVLYTDKDIIPEGKEIGDIRKPAQVTGELMRRGDGESISEGALIPMLVKSIQELTARIEELEGE
jgi:hypothetical protein